MASDTITTDLRFAMLPEWVLYADGLTDRAVRLYAVLDRYANSDGTSCFPSRRTIARRLGCSVDSVDRAMAELLELGAVEREHQHGEGGQTTNAYLVRKAPQPQDSGPAAGVRPPQPQDSGPPSRTGAAQTENHGTENPSTETSSSSPDGEDPAVPATEVAAAGWDQARELCEYLAAAIVESRPPGGNTRPPRVTQAWVVEMERLVRLEGHDPEVVRRAIDWAHRGPGSIGNGNGWAGWGAQVQSPAALRKHWDKMAAQAAAKRNGNGGASPGTAMDVVQRAMASGRYQ